MYKCNFAYVRRSITLCTNFRDKCGYICIIAGRLCKSYNAALGQDLGTVWTISSLVWYRCCGACQMNWIIKHKPVAKSCACPSAYRFWPVIKAQGAKRSAVLPLCVAHLKD